MPTVLADVLRRNLRAGCTQPSAFRKGLQLDPARGTAVTQGGPEAGVRCQLRGILIVTAYAETVTRRLGASVPVTDGPGRLLMVIVTIALTGTLAPGSGSWKITLPVGAVLDGAHDSVMRRPAACSAAAARLTGMPVTFGTTSTAPAEPADAAADDAPTPANDERACWPPAKASEVTRDVPSTTIATAALTVSPARRSILLVRDGTLAASS